MNKFLLFVAMLIVSFANAQTARRACGSMEVLDRLKQEDPALVTRMQQIEQQTAVYVQQHKNVNTLNTIITIPVVFHIVYNTTSQNISDAQCIAQLNQLNLDYARLNSDRTNTPTIWQGISANTNIQFCLAQRTPTGTATTGIERRQTSSTSFSTNDNVKHASSGGMDAWTMNSYLNIWVCKLSGGILGYAQFPGGGSASTDGVVLHYTTVGSMLSPGSSTGAPYNMGRTATHEVGHWLNLIHIWGDESACSGSDNVGDTPNQGAENYDCPTYPLTDNCQSANPGVMFMNYMDYVDDGCMNMFTNGQSSRMNALFGTGGARVILLSSLACTPPNTTSCGVPSSLTTTAIGINGATLNWAAVTGATSYNIQYKVNTATTWTTVTSTTNSKILTGLMAGNIYQWQVQSICAGGSSTYSSAVTFTTTAAANCGTPVGLTSASVTTTSAALTWTAVTGATSYNIQYKTNAASTWNITTSTTNSKTLTGLLNASGYQWQVQSVCASGTSTYSAAATFTTLSPATCGVPANLLTSSITATGAVFGWSAVTGATSYNVQYKVATATTWTSVTTSSTSLIVTGLNVVTTYQWQIRAVCTSGTSAYSSTLTFTTTKSGCSDVYEPNASYTTAGIIPTNTTITGIISSSIDGDWYKVTTVAPNTKIKILLSNLPADYDVRLYNSALTYLAISQNGGTTSESIIYNATTVNTYYIRVYGYNGVYNSTTCYSLLVNSSSISFKLSADEEEITPEEAIGQMKVYPNPAHDNVNVAFNSAIDQLATIRVFDMMGKTVFLMPVELTTGENKFNFDMSVVPQGIYFCELQNSSDRIVTKFIVEK
jgi:hypothetical protein